MRHYVTLFDKNYLAKGLSLYQSLVRQSSEDWRLWVLPLDDWTSEYLKYQVSKHVMPKLELLGFYNLPEIVTEQRDKKPWNFFCFSLAPEVITSVMNLTQKQVTYLDSDTYFFRDPKLCFDEMGDKEVGIVSHNFPPHDYNRLRPNGLYNVSFVSFKYKDAGINILKVWRDAVRKKCDAESCGDQKYLDLFPEILGDKLHIFDGIRIGAGPWNGYTYNYQTISEMIYYHFHELKRIAGDNYYLTGYKLSDDQKKYLYEPYLKVIKFCQNHVDKKIQETFYA